MEIERKFLLEGLPPLKPIKHCKVTQGYISTYPEVRIRSSTDIDTGKTEYKLGIKGEGDLSREEIEVSITSEVFDEFALGIKELFITKDYYVYKYKGLFLECSIVDNNFFTYGEIEFKSEEEAKNFIWPFPGAIDITYNSKFKMKNYWNISRKWISSPLDFAFKALSKGNPLVYCSNCLSPLNEQDDLAFLHEIGQCPYCHKNLFRVFIEL